MQENDDLQSSGIDDEQDFVIDDGADLDEQDQELESDPTREPVLEQKTVDDAQSGVNQEAINAAIDKQHAKYREEQRKRIEAEKRAQELEERYGAQVDPEPSIPTVDFYAADAEEQVKQRDMAVRKHQEWEQRQNQRRQQQQESEQQSLQQQRDEAQQQADKFFSRAKELKVSQDSLNKAIQTVGQYQLGTEVAKYLMSDDKGVQMTTALAKNPALLADLATMQPSQAILHIERNVRSKLKAVRSSSAKRPPKRVSGSAAKTSEQYPLTGGKVTVE